MSKQNQSITGIHGEIRFVRQNKNALKCIIDKIKLKKTSYDNEANIIVQSPLGRMYKLRSKFLSKPHIN